MIFTLSASHWPRTHFAVFAGFVGLIFLMGGGSRPDITSLVFLRPIALLALVYAIIFVGKDELRRMIVPLSLLIALALLMIAQLVPLPANLWTQLPGRAPINELGQLIGFFDIARPLTFSPSKTMNSLAALSVPAAALTLYAIQDAQWRRWIPAIFASIAVVSALLGLLQIAAAPGSNLYFYEITNGGSPVGLFANRNHQAVFLACSLLCIGHLMIVPPQGVPLRWAALVGLPAAVLIFGSILINPSRAGILSAGLAVLFVAISFWARRANQPQETGSPKRKAPLSLGALGIIGASALWAASMFLADRAGGIARLTGDAGLGGLRVDILPVLAEMWSTYTPWGAGFGTFEYVYRIHEPDALLMPAYVNNAHNDWMQFLIEGGLPAALLGGAAIVWILARFVKASRALQADNDLWQQSFLAISILIILGMASLVDYPLRVPSLMGFAIVVSAMLTLSTRSPEKDKMA